MSIPVSLSQRVVLAGDPPISALMAHALNKPDLISLAAGFVDQQSLPAAETQAAFEDLLRDPAAARAALQYGTTVGDLRLRQLLCDHLADLDGCELPSVTPERMIIGTGSEQLLYLVAEALLDPGDIVLVGMPSYFVFIGAVESFGARVVGVRADEHGVVPESLEDALRTFEQAGELERVKLIYDVTYFNNPSGICLSANRRPQLVDLARRWSKRHRILILEDAPYRELCFRGEKLPSLLSHDPAGESVLYAGSFSKSFAPGLRTGYLVAPRELIDPIVALKGSHDFGSPNFAIQLLRRVLESGAYHRHVVSLRSIYREKCDALLETLEAELGSLTPRCHWTRPSGGMHVWMELPSHVSTGEEDELFRRCVDAGVLYVPGQHFFPRTLAAPPKNCLRLSYGVLPPATLREGARRFCRVLRSLLDA